MTARIPIADLRHDGAEWIGQDEIDALVEAVEAAHEMLGNCAVIDDGSGTLIALSDALARFDFGPSS